MHLADNNLAGLQQELGLCTAPNSSTEFVALALFLTNTYSFGVEFNYAQAQPGRTLLTRSLDLIVDATIAQSDPIQVLNVTQWLVFGPLNFTCLDYLNSTSDNGVYAAVSLIQYVPFSYIFCVFFLKHIRIQVSHLAAQAHISPSGVLTLETIPYFYRLIRMKLAFTPFATRLGECNPHLAKS